MSTPHEKTIEIAGQLRTLRFGPHAIFAIEEKTGQPLAELLQSRSLLRAKYLLWAGLLHDTPNLTLEAAEILVSRIKGKGLWQKCKAVIDPASELLVSELGFDDEEVERALAGAAAEEAAGAEKKIPGPTGANSSE